MFIIYIAIKFWNSAFVPENAMFVDRINLVRGPGEGAGSCLMRAAHSTALVVVANLGEASMSITELLSAEMKMISKTSDNENICLGYIKLNIQVNAKLNRI